MKTALFGAFKLAYAVLARTPLRRVPGIFALSNLFFRLFWPKGNVIRIQDVKMYIDVHDPDPAMRKTFQAYGMDLVHEEATTKVFKKAVGPGSVVLDLGANIGYFTLIASRLAGPVGRVISFEPEPRNFGYLKRNVELNGFSNVAMFQKAVSDRNGKIKLFICDYDSGHHTIDQYGGIEAYSRGRPTTEHAIEIESVRLDDFLPSVADRVDVVKMDVEGAEALAVAGMRQILGSNPDLMMFAEFFPLLMKQMGSSPEAYVEELQHTLGFRMYAIAHDYDMADAAQELVAVSGYRDLAGMLHDESDHVNLLLTRRDLSRGVLPAR